MEYVSLYPHLYGYSMNKHIITEISPLSEKDCLFIVERYKTEFTYPLHNHKEYELNFVENGAGVRRIVGDSVEEIGDYDLVLLCGDNLRHVWEQGSCQSKQIQGITIRFLRILFSNNFIDKKQFTSIRKARRAQKGLSFPLHAVMKVYSTIDSLLKGEPGFYQFVKFLTILYELSICDDARTLSSSSFARSKTVSDSRRVQKVEEYINLHYTEEIRLSQLAELTDMTSVSFSRFFKLRTGKSLSDYIIDIRLGHATRQLVDSTKTVAEICYECGFNNLSNFNRIFKKKKGCSPKEFREIYYKKKIFV